MRTLDTNGLKIYKTFDTYVEPLERDNSDSTGDNQFDCEDDNKGSV